MLAPESTCCVLFNPICFDCNELVSIRFKPGVVQAVPSKLTDSKPIAIETDVKRMVIILSSYVLKLICKFCAKKFGYKEIFSQTSILGTDISCM